MPPDAISKVSFAVFIPMYFVIVRYLLELGQGFSLGLLLAFLIGSSLLCLLSVGLAARLAAVGSKSSTWPLRKMRAVGQGSCSPALRKRPGSSTEPSSLLLTAILTSQAAGVWLGYVLRKGWPLLSEEYEQRRDGPSARRLGES